MNGGVFYRRGAFQGVPRLVPLLFGLLLLGAGVLSAGCLGPVQRDDPVPPVEEGDPAAVGSPQVWTVGRTWTYAVSGAWVEDPGFVTLGVVKSDGEGHLVASDDPKEWARAFTGAGGLLVGRVDPDTLAPVVDGLPRDLLGFERATGESWDVVLWGTPFTVQRSGTIQLDGGPGHRTVGVSPEGREWVSEYDPEVGWFTRFDLRDAEGDLLLGYRFVRDVVPDPLRLQSWHVLQTHRVSGFPDRMGHLQWDSDGEADRLVVSVIVRDDEVYHRASESGQDSGLIQRVRGLLDGLVGARSSHSSSAGSAVATVLSPNEDRVFHWLTPDPGMRFQVVVDEPGSWHLIASSGGPTVELSVHRVQVQVHVLS